MGKLYTEKVNKDIETSPFDCGVKSINEYVKNSYFATIAQHAAAYNIMYGGKCLGNYMVTFQEVTFKDLPEELLEYDPEVKSGTVTAVHINHLAIKEEFQGNHIGQMSLDLIIGSIFELAKKWPIVMITIKARNDLVDWYKRVGFKLMPHNTPGQQGVTTDMYMPCSIYTNELAEYEKEHEC